MALQAVVESVESLPESIREHYQAGEDGRYVLSVTPTDGLALENVEGLKTTLGKYKEDVSKLTGRLKAFGDLDPAQAREALAKIDELGTIDPKKEADKLAAERVELIKRQLTDAHAKEVEARDGRIGSLTQQLSQRLLDAEAIAAITDPEIKGNAKLLLPHVKSQTRVVEREGDDGDVVLAVEIIDPKTGTPRIGDAQGNPMTFKQLVSEMRAQPEYAVAFEGAGQSGGGTRTNNGGSTSTSGKLTAEQAGQLSMAEYRQAKKDGRIE